MPQIKWTSEFRELFNEYWDELNKAFGTEHYFELSVEYMIKFYQMKRNKNV